MKKKTALLLTALALVLAMGGAGNAATLPMGGPSKTTPEDLPVVKLPKDMAEGPSMPAGNPHGTPPGQDKKPPPDPPAEPEANKWAVVIGIADYVGRDSDLWHPDEDGWD